MTIEDVACSCINFGTAHQRRHPVQTLIHRPAALLYQLQRGLVASA
jgi:hypothetical protein